MPEGECRQERVRGRAAALVGATVVDAVPPSGGDDRREPGGTRPGFAAGLSTLRPKR
ncbi:hypothetical protein ACSHWB_35220 [Lentzea sp. HUAS TT2]|uniref:hypothetical protein n=1 Tax=Lentzea sp. HUAS TT2 TaxID=3447454 RepID=UPI003F6E5AE4